MANKMSTLTAEQIETRLLGVTGSEIAAVVGLSKWAGPGDVWASKLGITDPIPTNAAMERGIYLEPSLLDWTASREGVEIQACGTLIKADDPLVIATPDSLCYATTELTEPIAIMEVKSPGPWTAKDWADPAETPDGIPMYYLPQVQWEMAAAGLNQAIVGALVGGELLTYRIDFDQELFDALRYKAGEFWRHVESGTPPPVDGSILQADFVKKHWSDQQRENMLELQGATEARMAKFARLYAAAKADKKALDEQIKILAGEMQAVICDAQGLQGDGWRATWKQSKDSQKIDWQAVALESGATKKLIQKHTETKPGSRRFAVKIEKGE